MNNALAFCSLWFPGNWRVNNCLVSVPPSLSLVRTNWPLPPFALNYYLPTPSYSVWKSTVLTAFPIFTFTHSPWHSWGGPVQRSPQKTTQRANYCVAAVTNQPFFPGHLSHILHSPRTDAFKLSSRGKKSGTVLWIWSVFRGIQNIQCCVQKSPPLFFFFYKEVFLPSSHQRMDDTKQIQSRIYTITSQFLKVFSPSLFLYHRKSGCVLSWPMEARCIFFLLIQQSFNFPSSSHKCPQREATLTI